MRTPEEIIKAMTADNRHILSATNEELSELILAIREYACDNHLQIKPLYEGWLIDIAYRIASPAQKKAWGNWADNQDANKPGLDISDAASALGKKGGSAISDAKKKSSADNLAKARAEGKKGGRPRSDNPVRKRPYHKKEE